MVEVGILYTDLSRVWVDIADIAEVEKKDEVLGITITGERGTRVALFDRLWNRANRYDAKDQASVWHGGDNYAIGLWGDSFFCDQWDDMEDHLHIRKMNKPYTDKGGQVNLPRPNRWPSDAIVTVFRGGWISVVDWEKALLVFDKEMF